MGLNPDVEVIAVQEQHLELLVHVIIVVFGRRASHMNLLNWLVLDRFTRVSENFVEFVLILSFKLLSIMLKLIGSV